MRIKLGPIPTPGERRIKSRFLLFPKLVNREWRWLEKARWREGYCINGLGYYSWWALEWVDDMARKTNP